MHIRNENCRCGIDSEWGMGGSMNELSENAIPFHIIYLPIFSFFCNPTNYILVNKKRSQGFLSGVSELKKSFNSALSQVLIKLKFLK